MLILIIIIIIIILICLFIYFFEIFITTYFFKTKNIKISPTITDCFISKELKNYIYTFNKSDKLFFIFPGLYSDNLTLHNVAKIFYESFNNKYQIFVFKYNNCFTSIDSISTHLMYIISTIIDTVKYNEINIIANSYGCSIAIDTIIKLQSLNKISKINKFICHKSFLDINSLIKYQNNIYKSLLVKLFITLSFGKYNYSNKQIINVKTNQIICINHPYDEVIPIEAQFNTNFCNKYNIKIIFDTYDNTRTSLFYKLFGNHCYLNMELIKKIMQNNI